MDSDFHLRDFSSLSDDAVDLPQRKRGAVRRKRLTLAIPWYMWIQIVYEVDEVNSHENVTQLLQAALDFYLKHCKAQHRVRNRLG